ncbi:hypothetical protein E2C01_086342 [Portunus trituberculatus]|uniref:Uncharacterized protein n=1 Tax=Portunus trituberculatus TaxID=210409 RepID=A0A5B7J9F1_PORTR|nr:hypothetical protein [Portunus trituberculatus]
MHQSLPFDNPQQHKCTSLYPLTTHSNTMHQSLPFDNPQQHNAPAFTL